jgi:glucuronate isomerase
MVSDSRKILSYGSRFEMFRRVLSDVLGDMVEKGQMPEKVAEELAYMLSYKNPKEFFNL